MRLREIFGVRRRRACGRGRVGGASASDLMEGKEGGEQRSKAKLSVDGQVLVVTIRLVDRRRFGLLWNEVGLLTTEIKEQTTDRKLQRSETKLQTTYCRSSWSWWSSDPPDPSSSRPSHPSSSCSSRRPSDNWDQRSNYTLQSSKINDQATHGCKRSGSRATREPINR